MTTDAMTHSRRVVTYQHAYVAGSTTLCSLCRDRLDRDPDNMPPVPVLGPVQHGEHQGTCDLEYQPDRDDEGRPLGLTTAADLCDRIRDLRPDIEAVAGIVITARECAAARLHLSLPRYEDLTAADVDAITDHLLSRI